MSRVQMNLRVPEEIKEWLYSEARKDDRDPGYFLTNLIRRSHMKQQSKAVAVASTKTAAGLGYSSWPYAPDQGLIDDWLKAKKAAGGSVSQTAINTVGKELHKAHAAGFTVEQCLEAAENAKWKGFKAEWMNSNSYSSVQSHTSTQTQGFADKHNQTDWAKGL